MHSNTMKEMKPHEHRLCDKFLPQIMCAIERNLTQFLSILKFENYFLYTRSYSGIRVKRDGCAYA